METFDKMIELFVHIITDPFMLVVFGFLIHFGRKVVASIAHDANATPSFADYWKKHPVQTVISAVSAFVAFALVGYFPDFDQMSPNVQTMVRFTAFSCGFMADSIVDAIGAKGMQRVTGIGDKS